MTVVLLAFLGGVLTILSPCILPVLPFVFARTGRSFVKDTLPLLLGMALTFTAVATLAAVGGGWAVRLNTWGRVAALVLLAGLGVALLSSHVAEWLARPFVRMGNRLLQRQGSASSNTAQSVLLGVATGFLWAPCAGPILGLILTGAAISGPNTQTTLLLLAYALGAMCSLAVATLAGNRVFNMLKRSTGTGEWVRRALGVAVLAAVVAIGVGWDTGLLTRLSLNSTNRIEQSLMKALPGSQSNTQGAAMAMQGTMSMQGSASMQGNTSMQGTGSMQGNDAMRGAMAMSMTVKGGAQGLPVEGPMPSLEGAVSWLNSKPLTPADLKGKVVLIDFWTYSCINCLRTLPYIKSWYEHYKGQGLIIIGVHSPEFAFEKNEANVQRTIRDFGIPYAVALDNDYAIWRAFNNQYWPAQYFIDAKGQIRGHHFGEGNEPQSEATLRQLLAEAGHADLPPAVGELKANGVQAAAAESSVQSPETYIGYDRAENFASTGTINRDKEAKYGLPAQFQLNQWALAGQWNISSESAVLTAPGGKIVFRFHARDLHLVLGPAVNGKPVRFKVTLDGQAPGKDHGVDVNEQGVGTVTEQRLYQLIRQVGDIRDRSFTIEFLDGGVQAYSFTFG